MPDAEAVGSWRAGAAWLVALVLLAAAAAKLWDPRAFQLQIVADSALPLGLTAVVVCVLPVLELVVAALLALPRWRPVGLVHAGLLAAAFAGWQAVQTATGTETCGCFGSWLAYPPAVGLAIDLALLTLVLGAWPAPRGRWRLAAASMAVALVAALVVAWRLPPPG